MKKWHQQRMAGGAKTKAMADSYTCGIAFCIAAAQHLRTPRSDLSLHSAWRRGVAKKRALAGGNAAKKWRVAVAAISGVAASMTIMARHISDASGHQ